MSKRTNTAYWTGKHWRIAVQKDGIRKDFYSSKPGRVGQREANAKADKWLDDGINVRGGRINDIYAEWLKNLQLTTSVSNWKPIDSRWHTWVQPVIGTKNINKLNEQNLQDIINNAYAAGKSKKTLQSLCTDLRAFLKYCRKCKLTTFTPEDLRIPSGARCKGKNVLQPQDLLTLFSVSTTLYKGRIVEDKLIYAYRFQVLTGLRPGELIGLRWSDISDNTVYIQRSVNVNGEVTQGKNQNAIRAFILSDMAKKILEDQFQLTKDCDTVFDIRSEQYYRRHLKSYSSANNMAYITPYELRHTFISVVKTLPTGEVKELVGHSQNMDTFGIYGHYLDGDKERTAKAVNDVFSQLLNKSVVQSVE